MLPKQVSDYYIIGKLGVNQGAWKIISLIILQVAISSSESLQRITFTSETDLCTHTRFFTFNLRL